MSDWFLVLFVLVGLLGSAFFSGTELAVTMASRVRVRTRAERGSRLARLTAQLLGRRSHAIALCLVGNSLMNVGLSVFGREALASWLSLGRTAADTVTPLVLVPVVLVFGEILPKAVSQSYPNRVLIAMTAPLLVARVLLAPLFWLSLGVGEAARRLAGVHTNALQFASREELKQLVARSEVRGFVEPQERELIHHIFEFWKLDPRLFRRGLQGVPHLDARATVRDAAALMRERRVARLVVARGDTVIGVVRASRLLTAGPQDAVASYTEPPVQLAPGQGLDRVLTEMQISPSQTGVLDLPGEPAAIVLMDDLIDALVGRAVAARGR